MHTKRKRKRRKRKSLSFYRTERSEVRYNDKKKEPKLRNPDFSVPQLKFKIDKHHINSSVQQGKLSFVRTSVRALWLLIVRYTSPMSQIFSAQRVINWFWGQFGVWMAQRIKHTTEGVKTLRERIRLITIHKKIVNIIIILLYSLLFQALNWKSKTTISSGVNKMCWQVYCAKILSVEVAIILIPLGGYIKLRTEWKIKL